MKKIIAFTLVLVLALSLTACNIKFNGGNNTSGTPSGGNPTGTSGAAGANATAKPNKDGSLDMAVTPDGNNGFVCATKDGGGFGVQWPGGAFGGNTQLHMSPITSKLDGIVTPGFTVEDKANPGQHVALSQPATIIFYSKDELPDNVVIVKYTDDMKNYMEVPSQGFMTDKGYFIVAEISSFSSYGVGAADGGAVVEPTGGNFARMEAEEHDIRKATPGTKSDDIDIFLRADSKIYAADSQFIFPREYTGLLDMNEYAMVDNSTKPPMVMSLHVADPSAKFTLIPNLSDPNGKLKSACEEWSKECDEIMNALNNIYNMHSPEEHAKAEEYFGQWLQENPEPAHGIYDGYIGWGTAHCQFVQAMTSAGGGKSDLIIDIPVIVVQEIGRPLRVFVANPQLKIVMLTGTFAFMNASEAAAPPPLHDPAKEYSPTKPFNYTPGGNEGEDVLKDSVTNYNSLTDNNKVMTSNGGWISARQLGTDQKVDQTEFDAFIKLWDSYVGAGQ